MHNSQTLSLANVERIEVVRGRNHCGTDAMGYKYNHKKARNRVLNKAPCCLTAVRQLARYAQAWQIDNLCRV